MKHRHAAHRIPARRVPLEAKPSEAASRVRQCGNLALVCVVVILVSLPLHGEPQRVSVASLEALAAYAAKNGNTVVMRPGIYRLSDYLTAERIAERRENEVFEFLEFSGSDNTFHLNGVTIEVDTALRTALRPPIHTSEFLVSGNHNSIIGLAITNTGDATSPGGALFEISGAQNALRDCTFWVQGSSPYGYGDLFGKGPRPVISHHKHSAVLIRGDSATLVGCRVHMRSYGHGYFVQDGDNHVFEDCFVEGAMRATDDMLAETSGPAFDAAFRSVYKNRHGENRVTSGYMKSLAEDGFRTYSQARNLVFRNCTAKYMRAGFELRTQGGVQVENCEAIGNERGYWVSSDAKVINSRGDARYGPLLFVEGDNAAVELVLAPTVSDMTVHGLATIHGSRHHVTLRSEHDEHRPRPLPILVGYSQPPAGEGMSPYGEGPARRVTLRNETTMPVKIGEAAEENRIITNGPVLHDAGKQNEVVPSQ